MTGVEAMTGAAVMSLVMGGLAGLFFGRYLREKEKAESLAKDNEHLKDIRRELNLRNSDCVDKLDAAEKRADIYKTKLQRVLQAVEDDKKPYIDNLKRAGDELNLLTSLIEYSGDALHVERMKEKQKEATRRVEDAQREIDWRDRIAKAADVAGDAEKVTAGVAVYADGRLMETMQRRNAEALRQAQHAFYSHMTYMNNTTDQVAENMANAAKWMSGEPIGGIAELLKRM